MLRNATVDAFRPHPQHTILEATLLPFERATPEPLRIRVTLHPVAREQGPPAPVARPGEKNSTPADPINRRCANKFRLHELACY